MADLTYRIDKIRRIDEGIVYTPEYEIRATQFNSKSLRLSMKDLVASLVTLTLDLDTLPRLVAETVCAPEAVAHPDGGYIQRLQIDPDEFGRIVSAYLVARNARRVSDGGDE